MSWDKAIEVLTDMKEKAQSRAEEVNSYGVVGKALTPRFQVMVAVLEDAITRLRQEKYKDLKGTGEETAKDSTPKYCVYRDLERGSWRISEFDSLEEEWETHLSHYRRREDAEEGLRDLIKGPTYYDHTGQEIPNER